VNLREGAAQHLSELVALLAGKPLYDQEAVRREQRVGDLERGRVDLTDRREVDVSDPGQLRRGVAQDRIGSAAERLADSRESLGLTDVERENDDVRGSDRFRGSQVDADDAALGTDALRQDFEPAAGPAAQVDDRGVARERRGAAQDVLELERRARPPPFVLGAAVERVLAVVARRRG
jgi:hypothetical protein